ncbi:hypothetical protein Tco_1142814, partial [Tanacetum coccineum]
MGLGAGSISSTPSIQGAPTAVKSMSDPDPLSSSRGTTTEIPTEHVATTEVNCLVIREESRVREIDLRSLCGRVIG